MKVIAPPPDPIIAPARRRPEDGPMTLQQAANARRLAEYWQRRQGIKAPLIQLRRA